MKLISVIGYSGSGKTHFISSAIKKLKSELNLTILVIKNVDTHNIDTEGKDSFEFSKAGADFSIIKNKYHEVAVFFKKELDFDELIDWISKFSENIDLVFIEGFRGLEVPEILCVENIGDINPQLNLNIKMISGIISTKTEKDTNVEDIPIINIEKQFQRFLEIFDIR